MILVFIARVISLTRAHLRLLSSLGLNQDEQHYFTSTSSFYSWIKRNILNAPLIHKRHNKEFQLSAATNLGILPSRLHSFFLSFYLVSNVVYCCILDYHNQPKAALIAEARGRTGHLAVYNLMPMILFSSRNNPFIPLLGVSFDTFNLFHRWIGRVVILQSLAHTFCWGINNYDARGLDGLWSHLEGDKFLIYGLISTITMTITLIQSVSIIRHAFYEAFLHIHQILGIATVVGIILHCESQKLPQIPFMYALIGVWALERTIRLLRMFHRRGTTLHVEALQGGACRVTFDIRGTWTRTPGRHIYAYIPSVSLWMSHPFSVAWVEPGCWQPALQKATLDRVQTPSPKPFDETLAVASPISSTSTEIEKDFNPLPNNHRTQISCIISSKTGMTASLFAKALSSPTHTIALKAFVEGPYGGRSENLRSYGTVVLFAGGVGITHQLSILRDLVGAFKDGGCATRKVVLIWSVRNLEQLDWVGSWLDDILQMPRRGCEVKILLYVTRSLAREDDGSEAKDSELGVREHVTFGRMDVRRLVREEFEQRIGAMSIGVCGPGGLADDVRRESRGAMKEGNVDFWEEAFTW